jgi:hypothetical protein
MAQPKRFLGVIPFLFYFYTLKTKLQPVPRKIPRKKPTRILHAFRSYALLLGLFYFFFPLPLGTHLNFDHQADQPAVAQHRLLARGDPISAAAILAAFQAIRA